MTLCQVDSPVYMTTKSRRKTLFSQEGAFEGTYNVFWYSTVWYEKTVGNSSILVSGAENGTKVILGGKVLLLRIIGAPKGSEPAYFLDIQLWSGWSPCTE